jgi:hypothetical protein
MLPISSRQSRRTPRREAPLGRLPVGPSVLGEEQRGRGQVPGPEPPGPGQGVPARQEQRHLLDEHRPEGELELGRRRRAHREGELTAPHPAAERPGAGDLQAKPDAGPRLCKRGEERLTSGWRPAPPPPGPPRPRPPSRSSSAPRRRARMESRTRWVRWRSDSPSGSESGLPALPGEERHPEIALHLLDVQGHRRLGAAQGAGGGEERPPGPPRWRRCRGGGAPSRSVYRETRWNGPNASSPLVDGGSPGTSWRDLRGTAPGQASRRPRNWSPTPSASACARTRSPRAAAPGRAPGQPPCPPPAPTAPGPPPALAGRRPEPAAAQRMMAESSWAKSASPAQRPLGAPVPPRVDDREQDARRHPGQHQRRHGSDAQGERHLARGSQEGSEEQQGNAEGRQPEPGREQARADRHLGREGSDGPGRSALARTMATARQAAGTLQAARNHRAPAPSCASQPATPPGRAAPPSRRLPPARPGGAARWRGRTGRNRGRSAAGRSPRTRGMPPPSPRVRPPAPRRTLGRAASGNRRTPRPPGRRDGSSSGGVPRPRVCPL